MDLTYNDYDDGDDDKDDDDDDEDSLKSLVADELDGIANQWPASIF